MKNTHDWSPFKDVHVASTTQTDETGASSTLQYYIRTMTEAKPPTYGLKIEQQWPGKTFSQATGGLTHSHERARKWARILAEGRVSPHHLFDFADDFTSDLKPLPARTYSAG